MIAYPMYGEYVIRGKLQEATSQLSDMRVKMEQYFMDNRRYDVAGGTPCGLTAAQLAPPGIRYFAYGCAAGATLGQTYVITANGVVTQGMGGFQLTINESNVKRTITAGSGWITPNPDTCWIQKKGGDC